MRWVLQERTRDCSHLGLGATPPERRNLTAAPRGRPLDLCPLASFESWKIVFVLGGVQAGSIAPAPWSETKSILSEGPAATAASFLDLLAAEGDVTTNDGCSTPIFTGDLR